MYILKNNTVDYHMDFLHLILSNGQFLSKIKEVF